MNEVAVEAGLPRLVYGAIQNKRLIRFRYKDKERIVEPRDYGVQNGVVRLHCWQVGGQSKGRIPGWRLIDVEGIENSEAPARTFPGGREVGSGRHQQGDELFIGVESAK